MKTKESTDDTVVVSKILFSMLAITLLMMITTVGYAAVFPDRDNAFLAIVRYGGSAFSIILAVVLTARGRLLRHIAKNW
jgi:ABC-type transport system involved in multi-copper enzyme maturation permease subunit